MKLIYQNFDGLDISFQGAFPKKCLEELEKAKHQAQKDRQDSITSIGNPQVKVSVGESGARGGYLYRFDTGLDGEIWFVSKSQKTTNWNIRVSVKSFSLALYGYEGVKKRILDKLVQFGTIGSGSKKGQLTERISRVDYCFDFEHEGHFNPTPDLFIAHQRCQKHCYGENVGTYSAGQGDLINTIRVGSMPGRQAVIYNKIKEIQSNSKQFWWDIWNIEKENFENEIWRVEIRAGKAELDKWQIKKFSELEEKIGDVFINILENIRYVKKSKDKNRSRWEMAEFWKVAIKNIENCLSEYISDANRTNIIRDYRFNIENRLKIHILGSVISYTTVTRRDISELTVVLEEFQNEIENFSELEFEIIQKKYDKTAEKYEFIGE
ncbi:MAG: hypothetical protein ACI9TY_000166 [Alphaproteobacteria bacterium]|jgi:hypothetical protein